MSNLFQLGRRFGTLVRTTLACAALCLCALSSVRAQGPAETVLHTFNSYADGVYPNGVIQGSDGNFYGTTYSGGTNSAGTIFKITPSGALTTIYSFTATTDGANPNAELAQGSDGTLYGTASTGGSNGYGTVFSIHPDGTSFQTLHSFNYSTDGGYLYSGLILGSDGKIYGTTYNGGTNGYGTVFQLTTDGTTFNVLHSFNYSTDGGYLYDRLVQGSDGKLYGTARYGGTNGYGTVFQLTTDGTTFNVLHAFSNTGTDGANPYADLVQSSSGKLYGTTYNGGQPRSIGTIFSITTASTFTSLYQFTNGFIDGRNPYYGTLTLGKDGNYYGTTIYGGVYSSGTLYKLTPTGTITILHHFNYNGTDGSNPYGGLAVDSKGVLYGTTYGGGTYGQGVVYSYNPTSGVYTILYHFGGNGGANLPTGLTIVGSTLYGVSYYGGQFNQGTVFKLTLPTSSVPAFETVLHSFLNNGTGPDGTYPNGLLLVGKDKNLYGTTTYGGQYNYGTVFKVSPSGSGYKVLHSFNYNSDGANPYAGLVQGSDSAGTLYGTTYNATYNPVTSSYNYGEVFKLTPTGSGFAVLHGFNYTTDGAYPFDGVTLGTDGKLYGATSSYGPNSGGTVYQLTTDGTTFNVLHAFNQTGDGYNPYSGVLEGPDGNLYGTTYSGGIAPELNTAIAGTVYQIQTALPIVSSFSPTSGSVSAHTAVTLKGVNLTNGAVTINGVAQTVTSSSATSLTFTLTTGTPTGSYPIVVTTATGSYSTGTKTFTVNP